MSAERFTKGPWRYEPATGEVYGSSDDILVCDVLPDGSINYERNGQLIAAAPEMYEMLKKAADELLFMIRKANSDIMQSVTSTTETEPDYYDEQTVFEIMKLLAKARGER